MTSVALVARTISMNIPKFIQEILVPFDVVLRSSYRTSLAAWTLTNAEPRATKIYCSEPSTSRNYAYRSHKFGLSDKSTPSAVSWEHLTRNGSDSAAVEHPDALHRRSGVKMPVAEPNEPLLPVHKTVT